MIAYFYEDSTIYVGDATEDSADFSLDISPELYQRFVKACNEYAEVRSIIDRLHYDPGASESTDPTPEREPKP